MTAATGWSLVLALALVMAGIVVCTVRWRVHAFLALIGAAFVFGAAAFVLGGAPGLVDGHTAAGAPADGLLTVMAKGFGGTLTSIGLVILFGTILGHILEKTGGALVLAESLLRAVGRNRAPLAIGLAGYAIGIPVFCDSGFIVLAALSRALAADAGFPVATMSTSLSMGLYSTHVMVPPTPGPLAAAGSFGADIGLVMGLGLVVALPATLAGVAYARHIGRRVAVVSSKAVAAAASIAPPPFALLSPTRAWLPILVPVALIALASVAALPSRPLGRGTLSLGLAFAGHPIVALAVGIGLAFRCVTDWKAGILDAWIGAAVKDAALILVITGAGGSLGAVIRATGIGDFLGATLSKYPLGLLLPFLIAATIKTAQGSSTVAIVTTAGILAPLLPALGWTAPAARALAVLAVGAGSMVVSHANDSYFWVVGQFSGMDVPTTCRTHTVASLVSGLTALAVLCGLWAWIGP